MKSIVQLACVFVEQYPEIVSKARPQSRSGETFYSRRRPEDSEIDVEKPLSEQFNLLRVVDNEKYPAFFRFRGCKYTLKIEKASQE